MKDRLHSILISLLIAAMLVGIGFWFFNHYELKPHNEQIGAQGEAARNSLYYSRLFLKRMGIPTESKTTLALPNTETVLVLDSERYVLSQNKINELWQWVAQGGHLITRLRDRQTHKEPPKGNDSASTTDDLDPEEESQPSSRNNKKSSQANDFLQDLLGIKGGIYQSLTTDELPLKATLPQSTKTLAVDFDLFRAIKSTEHTWALSSPKGDYWVVHKNQGKGAVTVVSEFDFADNSSIGNEDNAEFFWALLHTHHTPQAVWIIRDQDFPSLLQLMWQYGYLVMFSFGVLLVLLAWAWMPRFGALIPLPLPSRRRITEHLQAAGRFEWFQQPQGRETMTEYLRHDTLQLAQKRLHEWLNLNEAQRLSTLGKPLQFDLSMTQHLFQAPQLKEADFIKLTQLNHYWRHCTTC
jgi:hypothetical protein